MSYRLLRVWSRLLPLLLVFGSILPMAPSSLAQSLPTLSITDASVVEGNSATTDAVFTVKLSASSTQIVTVQFATGRGCSSPCCLPNESKPDVLCPVPLEPARGVRASSELSPIPCLDQAGEAFICAPGGTATPGVDYVETSGALTFNPGDTTKTVAVAVKGDTNREPDETYFVVLSSAIGATITDPWGQGTIVSDDGALPSLSIDDVSVTEGNSGTTDARFTLGLTGTSDRRVTVQFATGGGCAPGCCSRLDGADKVICPLDPEPQSRRSQSGEGQDASRAPCFIEPGGIGICYGRGTATPGTDYATSSGTLTFEAGDKSKSLTVQVKGDTESESSEPFFVTLSNPTEAAIGDGLGQGTIIDDDRTTASVDLAVTNTDSADPVAVRAELTYTVKVANKGTGRATGVKLVDTLPQGVSFRSATPSRGSCDRQKRVITCSLGNLESGADATVTIVVTPTKAGTITNEATVAGDQPEQDMANNKATQTTTVTGRR